MGKNTKSIILYLEGGGSKMRKGERRGIQLNGRKGEGVKKKGRVKF